VKTPKKSKKKNKAIQFPVGRVRGDGAEQGERKAPGQGPVFAAGRPVQLSEAGPKALKEEVEGGRPLMQVASGKWRRQQRGGDAGIWGREEALGSGHFHEAPSFKNYLTNL
jgi:hypothetical protein